MTGFQWGEMKTSLFLTVVVLLAASAVSGAGLQPEPVPIGVSDYLPDLLFGTELSKEDAQYLGLDSVPPVALADVESDLLVIELLVAQCSKCQKQAPVFEGAYRKLAAQERLRDRVSLVGVGVGNSTVSLDMFRETYKVTFPLLADDSLAAFDLLGRPGRTPFTIFARREEKGKWIVVSVHGGAYGSDDELVEEIKATLEYDLAVIKGEAGKEPPVEPLESVVSGDEIKKLLVRSADTLVGKAGKTALVTLGSGHEVYVIYGSERRKLFARVESRRTICGDCHDSHFIYIFNTKGEIVDFIPISLTKIGNVEWDETEVAYMKERLIGRSIEEGDKFDTKVDALTGATITSILIFDSLRDARLLYESLVSEGHMKGG